MSKITFRADDDLIEQLETFDASKSEVMREALREYLGEPEKRSSEPEPEPSESVTDTDSIDELIADRVDSLIADRLAEATPARQPQDVNVNITLDGESGGSTMERDVTSGTKDRIASDDGDVSHDATTRKTEERGRESAESAERKTCAQCGDTLAPDHVYCPNCGEKASRRVFCDCGDELRSDWGFCPGCGRRTPAADVLDQA